MPRQPAFLEFEFPPPPPERARFELIPAPLENGISYGRGTAAGPAALLDASQHLEAFDGAGIPAEAGIHTGAAIDCRADTPTVLRRIAERVAAVLAAGRMPVVIGGEHTVTLGAIEALAGRGEPFGVVQFDAHADLRDTYENNPYSHACVMRRIVERGIPLFQVGVRSLSAGEAVFRRERGLAYRDAAELAAPAAPPLALPPGFPRRIYLTFDVDALDPAVMPGTGTPEPGGLYWYDALRLVDQALAGRELAAFDVVELAPIAGSAVSEFTAAKLVYHLVAAAQRHCHACRA